MKDMFYYSGTMTKQIFKDGMCADCPFRDNDTCDETEQDVSYFVTHGKINNECLYLTK